MAPLLLILYRSAGNQKQRRGNCILQLVIQKEVVCFISASYRTHINMHFNPHFYCQNMQVAANFLINWCLEVFATSMTTDIRICSSWGSNLAGR